MAWGQVTTTPKVIASTGKTFAWSNYEVSYTAGEQAAVTTLGSTSGLHLTQGFHQEEELVLTGLDNLKEAPLNFVLYPNPTASTLWVGYEMTEKGNSVINLTDQNGKVVSNLYKGDYSTGRVIEHFDVSTIASGSYLLTLQFTSATGKHYSSTKQFSLTH